MNIEQSVKQLVETLKMSSDVLENVAIVVYAESNDDLSGELVEKLNATGYKSFSGETKLPTLQYGDSGKAVCVLQAILNYFGFDSGNIDGLFGGNTQSAVHRYQDMHGLTVDGVVGVETWESFFERI